MRSTTLCNWKNQLKSWGKEIRENKNKRKVDKEIELWKIDSIIRSLKYDYRHNHIAYCELRGRTREQIEKPSQFNLPDEKLIDIIKQNILQKLNDEQTVRTDA